jgi:hypothetical protein
MCQGSGWALMTPNQGMIAVFFKDEKMVRSLTLVVFMGMFSLLSGATWAQPQKKRFIVRYKTQKLSASGALFKLYSNQYHQGRNHG